MLPGDSRTHEKQLKAYEYNRSTGWTSPNSTDIHALHRIKNVAAYIAKYISKDVTKTRRVERMAAISFRTEQLNNQIELLQYEKLFSPDSPMRDNYINEMIAERFIISEEYATLVSQGVQGRIWGCSQRLSRCRNFVDMSTFDTVPDIALIEKNAVFKKIVKVGSSNILTYVFDIQKTPNLKSILDTHLAQTVKDQLI